MEKKKYVKGSGLHHSCKLKLGQVCNSQQDLDLTWGWRFCLFVLWIIPFLYQHSTAHCGRFFMRRIPNYYNFRFMWSKNLQLFFQEGIWSTTTFLKGPAEKSSWLNAGICRKFSFLFLIHWPQYINGGARSIQSFYSFLHYFWWFSRMHKRLMIK